MNKINILLTGASGSVGREVFQELWDNREKFKIRLFIRGSKKNKKLFDTYRDQIQIVWGDIRDLEAAKVAVKNTDIIIHSAALIPPLAYVDHEKTIDINVGGTQNILEAAKKTQANPKIIYTSSIAVYGDRLSNPYIKSNDEVNPNEIYSETKYQAEKLIRKSGFPYLILRLSYCATTDSLKFDPVMFKMPLETPIEIIDTRDVALAIVNSIMRDDLWNNTYLLGGGENCRIIFRDFLDEILTIMGFGRNFLPEEAFAKNSFNCGYCDTNKVQELLKYQRYDLNDFYKKVRKWIGIKRHFIPLVKYFIKQYLLNKSKYYQNNKKNPL